MGELDNVGFAMVDDNVIGCRGCCWCSAKVLGRTGCGAKTGGEGGRCCPFWVGSKPGGLFATIADMVVDLEGS